MMKTPTQPPTSTTASAWPDVELIKMTQGYQLSQIVTTFARLGLADHLAAGARSGADLAQVTGADPHALTRFLRAAASVGLVEQLGPDQFGLTSLGEGLRSSPAGPSLRDVVVGLSVPALYRPYERLLDAVMTGQTVTEQVLGTDVYHYFEAHPEEGRRFAGAMSALSTRTAARVAPCVDVTGVERIVDVGGSHGALLAGVLQAAPCATGILFDLPEVIAGARRTIAERGLAERVECVAGDFFESVPEDGDLYILSQIIHNWDDEQAARLLANCHRASKAGSKLLLVEMLVSDEPDASFAPTVDLVMLTILGGRERSRDEHERLLARAGYRLDRVVATPSLDMPVHLLEASRL